MIDVVYITGGRSAWQNNELRYSIRSLIKYLKNLGNIYIIGTCPEWLRKNSFHELNTGNSIRVTNGIIHIQAEDHINEKKEPRLYRKRLIACRNNEISEDALFIYDDEYLLMPNNAETFPNYFDGNLQTYYNRVWKRGHHKRCTLNTLNLFGPEGYMFDVHCPMLINRKKFIDSMSKYDWSKPDGYLIKSTYANSIIAPATEIKDIKINHPDYTLQQYEEMVSGRPWFSTGDNCNFQVLGELMEKLYPEKSIFES